MLRLGGLVCETVQTVTQPSVSMGSKCKINSSSLGGGSYARYGTDEDRDVDTLTMGRQPWQIAKLCNMHQQTCVICIISERIKCHVLYSTCSLVSRHELPVLTSYGASDVEHWWYHRLHIDLEWLHKLMAKFYTNVSCSSVLRDISSLHQGKEELWEEGREFWQDREDK